MGLNPHDSKEYRRMTCPSPNHPRRPPVSNIEVIEKFLRVLKDAPDLTMSAIRVRLSCTDYELVLKKADPLKPFMSMWDSARKNEDELYLFPMNSGEKGVPVA